MQLSHEAVTVFDATNAGASGTNGATAIIVGNLTIDMTGELTVIGGSGGNGANGSRGNDGSGNNSPGGSGNPGGTGGLNGDGVTRASNGSAGQQG